MLDVQKLERRWLKYKIKKIAPYFLSFFGVALLSTVIFTWFDHQSQNNQMTIVNKDDNSSPKQPQAKSLSSVKEHATVVLEPSMDFVQNFKSSPSPDESPNQIPTNAPKHPMTTPLPPSKPLEMPKYPQSVKSPSAVTNKNPTNLGSLFINRHESKINIE
ncbi:MAG: hypothetical protein IE884_01670, partial [Sulfuricurvum sp.]|nr:hypothetical protein [Sulfuricurvum sp.]